MKKEVLFFLLDEYADWESAFLSVCLHMGVEPGSPVSYTVKTVAVSKEPVRSLGGFATLPDYDLSSVPEEYAALILVGGMQWQSEQAQLILPEIRKCFEKGRVVGAICNASVFLGANGFLNDVKHTSNTVELLKQWGGDLYKGEDYYVDAQAVSDRNVVTANGTGYLEFTREVLLALGADTHEAIERSYNLNKIGLCELTKTGGFVF